MRCLWITRQDPSPADSGELIYSRGLLASLAAQPGIELHVLAHSAPAGPNIQTPPGRWHLPGPTPPKRALGVISRLPGDADRLGNPPMRAELRSLLVTTNWDWIVIDQAACGWALDEIPTKHPARIAYVAHNHESSVRPQVAADQSGSLALRIALRRDAVKYARLECAIVKRSSLVTAITPRDQSAFRQQFPNRNVILLPPGHDGPIPPADPRPIDRHTPRRVVLAGTFLWIAKRRNLEAFLAASADPFLAAGIDFQVVGKADPAFFARLARQYPRVSFQPNVPSIHPWLTDGLIPEALGGGFKLKALDYVFRGLPLAAVDEALSGLPLAPGSDAITAANPAALAHAVAAKIDDLPFLNLAARSALAKCRHAFNWADRGARLAEALLACAPITNNK